jgi:lipid A 3-O-deacylase
MRRKIGRGLGITFLLAGVALASARATDAPILPEARSYEFDFSSGILWNVGGGATPLSYTLMPQILSLRISPGVRKPFAGGILAMRPRFSLLLEPIVHGPESYYVGAAAAGDLEWRTPSGHCAIFFSSGGGAGYMDSKGYEIRGAQGQDFNLNWLIHSGIRLRGRDGWEGSAGLYFQHVSNGGRDKVNPGLNALGPMVGISRRF